MRIGFYAAGKYEDAMIRMNGPAVGLAYISAYLKQEFPNDIEEIFLTLDAESMAQRKPDLVGISAFTYAFGEAIAGSEYLRKALPNVPILVGGPHISALPGNLAKSMDIGVIGEGELPMREIVRLFLAKALTPQNLRQISGLIYWNDSGEQEYSISANQRIDQLDLLPHPDRKLLRASWQGEEISWQPSLITSRGCPFTCNFCMYSKSANLVRYHSIDYVMEEIEQIARDNPDQMHLLISDDLFVTKKSRLKELGNRLREAGLNKRLTFGCMAKASFFDAEYAQLLKDMNVISVAFGFESGSDSVLHYLKDKHSSVAKNQQALDLCFEHGIQVGGYFIIGSPDETPADMAKTYWFIRQNTASMPLFGINMLLLLPGTQIWHEAKAQGLIDEHFSKWEYFNYQGINHQSFFFINRQYSREFYLEAYHKHFFQLKAKISDYLALHQAQKIIQHMYFSEMILPQIRAQFAAGSRLLLLGRIDRILIHTLSAEYQVTECPIVQKSWSEADILSLTRDQDGMVLLHAIGQTGFESPFWQRISQIPLPLLLINENAATLARIGAILSGKGLPFNTPLNDDLRYHYSLPQYKAHLARRHQILSIERNRLPRLNTPFGEKIAEMKDQALGTKLSDQARLYEFPLVAHMLQPFHDQEVITKLRKTLPVDTFLHEADVYSYSFWLQPVLEVKACSEAAMTGSSSL